MQRDNFRDQSIDLRFVTNITVDISGVQFLSQRLAVDIINIGDDNSRPFTRKAL